MGDTHSLDLYDSGYATEQRCPLHDIQPTDGMTLTHFPLVEEIPLGIQKDYEETV